MARDGSVLSFSALESERFGLRIFRARDFTFDPSGFVRDMIAADCDVAIVRLPAGVGEFAQELAGLGFDAVHADTLVYYECSLGKKSFVVRPSEGLTIERAVSGDGEELFALVRLVFQDYPGHYAANELFDPLLAAAGYAEWAINFIDAVDRQVFLARVQGDIVGFLTLEIHEQTAEIVLNGVHPAWSGRGVYGSLVRAAQMHAQQLGAGRMIVSTQIANMAVQRAWHREGFRLYAAYDTFHVNALLHTGTPVREYHLDTTGRTTVSYISLAVKELLRLDPDLDVQGSSLKIVAIDRLTPGRFHLVMRSVRRTQSHSEHLVGRLKDAKDETVAILRADRRFLTPTEAPPQ